MSFIVHATTALPAYSYSQEEVFKFFLAAPEKFLREDSQIRAIFENAQVQQRYFVHPLHRFAELGSFSERNQIYFEQGLKLCLQAARKCLSESNISPEQVTGLIFVSTTGFVVPSLDAYLIQEMRLPAQTRRIPVFGWGCTGGVQGLARALEYTRAYPQERVLLVNLELCSLAYQVSDTTAKGLIGGAIFNDGATAVLIEGKEVSKPQGKLNLCAAKSYLFPQTYSHMGWKQKETGLEVILAPEIPDLVDQKARGFVDDLLKTFELAPRDLDFVLCHPGGAKILTAFQRVLELKPEKMAISWEILKNYGNMSSCSVIFELEKLLRQESHSKKFGIMTAFGPGFSAEGLVLQWK